MRTSWLWECWDIVFWCFVWSVCLRRCYFDSERGRLYLYWWQTFIRWLKGSVYSAAKTHIFRSMQTFTVEYVSWEARARFSTPSYTVNYPIIYTIPTFPSKASPDLYIAGSFTMVFQLKIFCKKCRILRKLLNCDYTESISLNVEMAGLT